MSDKEWSDDESERSNSQRESSSSFENALQALRLAHTTAIGSVGRGTGPKDARCFELRVTEGDDGRTALTFNAPEVASRYPQWAELGITLDKEICENVTRRYYALDMHFRQSRALEGVPFDGVKPRVLHTDDLEDGGYGADEDGDTWHCLYADFSVNRLKKVDRTALAQLPHLHGLDLSVNLLSKIEGIESVRRLQVLNLAHNKVADLSSITRCTSLHTLDMSYNGIVSIQGDLSKLCNLQALRLDGNGIEDVSALATLKNLRILELQSNSIRRISPLRRLGRLEYLDLAENCVADMKKLLKDVRHLGAVKHLRLAGNPVTLEQDYSYKIFDVHRSLVSVDHVHVSPAILRLIDKTKKQNTLDDVTRLITAEYQAKIESKRSMMESGTCALRSQEAHLLDDYLRMKETLQQEMEKCIAVCRRFAARVTTEKLDESTSNLEDITDAVEGALKDSKGNSQTEAQGSIFDRLKAALQENVVMR